MIDLKTVQHIANLAKLELSEDEAKNFSEQLTGILGHFKKLEEVDTSEEKCLYTPNPISQKLREDVLREFNDRNKIIENAPESSGQLFKVPPVVS
ncbi:MAG: Asp-tRNA(Asn)/Glu-tRNA(Gln) amidotransferase GatCAB subunit C [Bdellovibrionaceae bacterium]|nr:Asp-tRNA(Asn)/Glu-tRNA(Gln) amidotransferase GatCAB subunit C [Pseudobdellovibrionaceae bacterium]|tara:strand:+ start:24426 stop:24710 length:285 start_codon:yes stop_codon:yes gene_type:complete